LKTESVFETCGPCLPEKPHDYHQSLTAKVSEKANCVAYEILQTCNFTFSLISLVFHSLVNYALIALFSLIDRCIVFHSNFMDYKLWLYSGKIAMKLVTDFAWCNGFLGKILVLDSNSFEIS
jgi:hypothetical protein